VAARLLRETSVPLSAIAGRVGYASEFAFAHAFKREHGLPPGRYRSERSQPDERAPDADFLPEQPPDGGTVLAHSPLIGGKG
jgi:AraC-like DNA-binding protein